MFPDEGGLRMTAPIPTEDQARSGGCCICPDGCSGIDAPDHAIACVIECGWCRDGCPARIGDDCTCLNEPATR